MMGFNFDDTISAGKGSSLQGNMIHTVKFDGCEAKTVDTKNGPSKVIDIRFSNSNGSYQHRIFEPTREEQFKDRVFDTWTAPSDVKSMMLLFRHLIDTVNPELGKEIAEKKKSLNTSSWDSLCKLVIDGTNPGIGKETKIKLRKNKGGFATFPNIAKITQAGNLDYKTRCIGDDLTWQAWELDQISKEDTAKPIPADSMVFSTEPTTTNTDPVDYNF